MGCWAYPSDSFLLWFPIKLWGRAGSRKRKATVTCAAWKKANESSLISVEKLQATGSQIIPQWSTALGAPEKNRSLLWKIGSGCRWDDNRPHNPRCNSARKPISPGSWKYARRTRGNWKNILPFLHITWRTPTRYRHSSFLLLIATFCDGNRIRSPISSVFIFPGSVEFGLYMNSWTNSWSEKYTLPQKWIYL